MKKVFYWYSDPGHGWLKVDLKILNLMAIAHKISHFSYVRGNYAYLEEDVDAGIFINAYEKLYGSRPVLKEGSVCANRESRIRNYYRYPSVAS